MRQQNWGLSVAPNRPKVVTMNFELTEEQCAIQDMARRFTADEISVKISQLLTPEGTNAHVKILYQSISDLHLSCPDHIGDWYFTGNYPTPGGVKVVNKAFMNYIEGKNERAY